MPVKSLLLRGAVAAALGALPAAANAQLILSEVIVELKPGAAMREDVDMSNVSTDRLYVLAEPREIVAPGMPAETDRRDPDPEKLGLYQVAETPESGGFLLQPRQGKLGRRPEAGNGRHVLSARPETLFLPAAADQPVGDLELVRGQDHGADSLRAADFVGGQRQRINPKLGHVDRDPRGRLDRIGMHQPAMGVDDPGRLGDRLENAVREVLGLPRL